METACSMLTTPRRINSRVKHFLKRAGLTGVPEFLSFSYVKPEYIARYCLKNCELETGHGGEMMYGWIIWEDKKKGFIEAEYHAVIRRDGILLDITPRVDNEKHVLFVPDCKRTARRISKIHWATFSNIMSQNGQIIQHVEQMVGTDEGHPLIFTEK